MSIKIQDPIHGAIHLSELETKIVDSAVFQRLRRIKQLGNVHLVFPNATHTRAAHSLGVMYSAGLLIDNLLKDLSLCDNLKYIKTIVRLAGLLHDLGHGAFSHLFESIYSKKIVNDLSEELTIPNSWLKNDSKKSYYEKKLEHENYSYSLIYYLYKNLDETIPAQDIISLLDSRFQPTDKLKKILKIIGQTHYGCEDTQSFMNCLKSILSGEIDADRLDYLQRDSHFCGIDASGLDIEHLLSSIKLGIINKESKKSFCIKIDENAVSTIENILIARKKMFDQVYLHRVNATCDTLLEKIFDKLIQKNVLSTPLDYNSFMLLDDITVYEKIKQLLPSENIDKNNELDLSVKLFLTRTTLKKIYEKTVNIDNLKTVEAELECMSFNSYTGKPIIKTINLKEFTKMGRSSSQDHQNSILTVFRELPNGKNITIPINKISEIIKSNAWSEKKAKVVVFKSLYDSAIDKNLKQKLKLHPIRRRSHTHQGKKSASNQNLKAKQ